MESCVPQEWLNMKILPPHVILSSEGRKENVSRLLVTFEEEEEEQIFILQEIWTQENYMYEQH